MTTVLSASDVLPLTCTREGTCCHGKAVWLNPWELACLAAARLLPASEFRDRFTDEGIRLKFAGGPAGACSQYAADSGCLAHPGRPLACRLYPLGRERRGANVRYVHDGKRFPCLDACPSVTSLPRLAVGDYLRGQATGPGEAAQDAYLEMAQDLAEGAFVVLFDSGLARTRGAEVLRGWERALAADTAKRADLIGAEWLDRLVVPHLTADLTTPGPWIAAHRDSFQLAAQAAFGALRSPDALAEASVRFLALALHLLRGIGGDPAGPGRRWLAAARERLAA
jgi:Fe-S-cluster containining protein